MKTFVILVIISSHFGNHYFSTNFTKWENSLLHVNIFLKVFMQFFFEDIVIYTFSYTLVLIHNSCFGLEVNIPFLQKEFAGRIQAVKEE